MTVTKEEIIKGLQAGRTLCIDRKDSAALPIVNDLALRGFVTMTLEQLDEQSSVLKVRWIHHQEVEMT